MSVRGQRSGSKTPWHRFCRLQPIEISHHAHSTPLTCHISPEYEEADVTLILGGFRADLPRYRLRLIPRRGFDSGLHCPGTAGAATRRTIKSFSYRSLPPTRPKRKNSGRSSTTRSKARSNSSRKPHRAVIAAVHAGLDEYRGSSNPDPVSLAYPDRPIRSPT